MPLLLLLSRRHARCIARMLCVAMFVQGGLASAMALAPLRHVHTAASVTHSVTHPGGHHAGHRGGHHVEQHDELHGELHGEHYDGLQVGHPPGHPAQPAHVAHVGHVGHDAHGPEDAAAPIAFLVVDPQLMQALHAQEHADGVAHHHGPLAHGVIVLDATPDADPPQPLAWLALLPVPMDVPLLPLVRRAPAVQADALRSLSLTPPSPPPRG